MIYFIEIFKEIYRFLRPIRGKNNVINKEVLERNKKYLMPTWKNNLARIYIILFLDAFHEN